MSIILVILFLTPELLLIGFFIFNKIYGDKKNLEESKKKNKGFGEFIEKYILIKRNNKIELGFHKNIDQKPQEKITREERKIQIFLKKIILLTFCEMQVIIFLKKSPI